MLGMSLLTRPMGSALAVQKPPAADPRAVLREAQAGHAAASRAAQAAAAAAGRGRAAVEAARQALAPFADLDATVAGHHAARLRAGDATSSTLPPELVTARRRRAAAGEALADAEAALALLDGEAKAAAAGVEAAVAGLWLAVDGVLQAAVLELVAQAQARTMEAARLRATVTGFLASRASVDPPVPWEVSRLTHEPAHAHLLDVAGPAARDPAVWTRLKAALVQDAAAMLPQP